jgi:hypothetical protein
MFFNGNKLVISEIFPSIEKIIEKRLSEEE